jgi:hypothetical protein
MQNYSTQAQSESGCSNRFIKSGPLCRQPVPIFRVVSLVFPASLFMEMKQFATFLVIACALVAGEGRELKQANTVTAALSSNSQLSTLLDLIKVIGRHFGQL